MLLSPRENWEAYENSGSTWFQEVLVYIRSFVGITGVLNWCLE